MRKISKTLTDISKELGSQYEIKQIDLEDCIYLNLHNGYDFEISGTRRRLGKIWCTLYIWQLNPSERIVEIVHFEKVSIEELRNKLNSLAEKYKDPNVQIPDSEMRSSTIKGIE